LRQKQIEKEERAELKRLKKKYNSQTGRVGMKELKRWQELAVAILAAAFILAVVVYFFLEVAK